MAKRKKRRGQTKKYKKRPSISTKLRRELNAAMDVYKEDDAEKGVAMFLQLVKEYPRSKPALFALLETSLEIEEYRLYAFYAEKVLPFERGEARAATLGNLVLAHTTLGYPAFAWYYTEVLITEHPDYSRIENVQELAETLEVMLLEKAQKDIGTNDFSNTDQFAFMAELDRVRFYSESGYPERAIPVAEALLKIVPHIIPLLNNLSFAYFTIGNTEKAIATAQSVLEQEPDNFHAVSNMVRYNFLTARFEQAEQYAAQLQRIPDDGDYTIELEAKRAEAFAFLGDDEQVWAAYERANKTDYPMHPILLHTAAVASYRLGDEEMAWTLWDKTRKEFPSFHLAQESLAERQLPIGERVVPWYWESKQWFTSGFLEAMEKYMVKSKVPMKQGVTTLLAEQPHLEPLFPYMLEYGDEGVREIVMIMIQAVKTDELLQTLYDFGIGRYGTDQMRLKAIRFVTEHNPALIPASKKVPFWVNGQQQDVLMFNFTITNEPSDVDELPAVLLVKFEDATELLLDGELDTAEQMLHEIIEKVPDFPSAYNQLAMVYEQQGKSQEMRELVEETHARFPDYLFARTGLAGMWVRDGRFDEARELLRPLWTLEFLHITEFRALARAEMDIALQSDQKESARIWLQMWQGIEEEQDNPELIQWDMRINPNKMMQGFQKLMGRG